MTLLRCTHFVGTQDVFEGAPPVAIVRNAVIVPQISGIVPDKDSSWGAYYPDGRLIQESAYRRGPGPTYVGQCQFQYLDINNFPVAPDDVYIYGGPQSAHYGHFLLATLSRCWQLRRGGKFPGKIICQMDHEPSAFYDIKFVRTLYGAMGIGEADLVRFSEPTVIRQLIVPTPSFEETGFGYGAYRDLCLRLFTVLAADRPAALSRAPIYLSKEQLCQGVRRVVNESEVSNRLNKAGVDIIFPEQLELRDQLLLFEDRSLMISTVGSALHSGIFAPNPCRVIAINDNNTLGSSFAIIDKLSGASVDYVYPASGTTNLLPDNKFSANIRYNNPIEIAEDILRLIDTSAC